MIGYIIPYNDTMDCDLFTSLTLQAISFSDMALQYTYASLAPPKVFVTLTSSSGLSSSTLVTML